MDLSELFHLHSSVLEPILRGTLMYLALFVLFRVVIRRRVGAVGMSDMLLVVIIADASQSGLSGDSHSVTDALLVVGTIFFWNWLIDWLNYRVPALKNVLEAPPLLLIDHGRVQRRNLRHEYVTMDELKSKLREHGITDPAQVDKAYMETDGEVTVIRKPGLKPSAPATSHQ
jgi:uncharacterized membrane protein YcaP (DUF421 family)